MKKHERIVNNVKADKQLLKRINKLGYREEAENIDNFIMNAERYIKAIKERRMVNTIARVSRSGMSRTMKFNEVIKGGGVLNFFLLFQALGHTEARGLNGHFSVSGCGMDMVFHTNYCNVRTLKRLGFISSKQCSVLEQMTPTTI